MSLFSPIPFKVGAASHKPSTSAPAPKSAAPQETAEAGAIVYDRATGRFLVDGEKLTLTEMLFKVTAKAAVTAKEMLAMTAQNLTDANNEGNAALQWRNKLAALEPDQGSSSSVGFKEVAAAAADFKKKWGFDPMEKYDLHQYAQTDGSRKRDDFEKTFKSIESYISSVSNNQSKINLDVERYTHIVTETNELTASVNKAISDLLNTIASKTG